VSARPENQFFRTLNRIVQSIPTWADYEAADSEQRAKIERAWKNNFTSDEAAALSIRAGQLKTAAAQAEHNATINAWAAERQAWISKHAPWLNNMPAGGYRKRDDDMRDYDKARDIATGENYETEDVGSSR